MPEFLLDTIFGNEIAMFPIVIVQENKPIEKKDTQLEIEFDKVEKEDLNKLTKAQLIARLEEEKLANENLMKENENIVRTADEKINKLKSDRNNLLMEKSKLVETLKWKEKQVNDLGNKLESIYKVLNINK